MSQRFIILKLLLVSHGKIVKGRKWLRSTILSAWLESKATTYFQKNSENWTKNHKLLEYKRLSSKNDYELT